MTPGMSLVCFAFAVTQVGRQGWLSSERVGRQALYRLTPVIDVAQARLGRQLQGERPLWSGSFNGCFTRSPSAIEPSVTACDARRNCSATSYCAQASSWPPATDGTR